MDLHLLTVKLYVVWSRCIRADSMRGAHHHCTIVSLGLESLALGNQFNATDSCISQTVFIVSKNSADNNSNTAAVHQYRQTQNNEVVHQATGCSA